MALGLGVLLLTWFFVPSFISSHEERFLLLEVCVLLFDAIGYTSIALLLYLVLLCSRNACVIGLCYACLPGRTLFLLDFAFFFLLHLCLSKHQ